MVLGSTVILLKYIFCFNQAGLKCASCDIGKSAMKKKKKKNHAVLIEINIMVFGNSMIRLIKQIS